MKYSEWAKKVEKKQGVTLEEAMEAMGLPPEYLARWEKAGTVPGVAVKFANGLAGEIAEVVESAPAGRPVSGAVQSGSPSAKGAADRGDKFGLNAVLADIVRDRLLAQNLLKSYTKADCSKITAHAAWSDDSRYRIVLEVTTASTKPVFKGDAAYSLSGFVFVKMKEALNQDDERKPEDIEKALSAMSGREVRVNGAVVFSS